MIKSKPINRSTKEVLDLLAGENVVRIPIKEPISKDHHFIKMVDSGWAIYLGKALFAIGSNGYSDPSTAIYANPVCSIGDYFYVREPHHVSQSGTVTYRADAHNFSPSDSNIINNGPWRSASLMPRNYSRITLKVIDIGVELSPAGVWSWIYTVDVIKKGINSVLPREMAA